MKTRSRFETHKVGTHQVETSRSAPFTPTASLNSLTSVLTTTTTSMGEGGFLTVVNGGPVDWTLSGTHSYQMPAWSWPATIPAGTSTPIYIEWDTNPRHDLSHDGGEATYTLPSGEKFQIQARAPGRKFNMQVLLDGIATQGNAKGSTISLGWEHDGHVNWILSGGNGWYSSSNPPPDWMAQNLAKLGSKTLKQITIPGSHDAGMGVFRKGTAFSTAANTQTQRLTLGDQLRAGSRYFDLRPVISGGVYKAGHYSYIDALKSWQGGNGQTITEIIQQINAFTASNKELIILNLSHDYNTDLGNDSYRSFTQAEWDALFEQLAGLASLWVAPGDPTTIDLTTIKLNNFIGGGRAAVVIIVEPSGIALGRWAMRGFYKYSQLNVYNDYSNTNNADTMSQDQLSKMALQKPQGTYFLLSWTLTQGADQVIVGPSILSLANRANQLLYLKLMQGSTTKVFPNILYVDAFTSQVTALAMALNNQFGG
jgi:hypothetical protein